MSLEKIGKFPFPPDVKRATVVNYEDTLRTMHGNENTIPLRIYVSTSDTFVAQITLLPKKSSDPMKFEGDNLTIPLKGTLQVTLTKTNERIMVKEFEGFYFPKNTEYQYYNPGKEKIEFLIIISPPPLPKTKIE